MCCDSLSAIAVRLFSWTRVNGDELTSTCVAMNQVSWWYRRGWYLPALEYWCRVTASRLGRTRRGVVRRSGSRCVFYYMYICCVCVCVCRSLCICICMNRILYYSICCEFVSGLTGDSIKLLLTYLLTWYRFRSPRSWIERDATVIRAAASQPRLNFIQQNSTYVQL